MPDRADLNATARRLFSDTTRRPFAETVLFKNGRGRFMDSGKASDSSTESTHRLKVGDLVATENDVAYWKLDVLLRRLNDGDGRFMLLQKIGRRNATVAGMPAWDMDRRMETSK
jgi:hypothetical protein